MKNQFKQVFIPKCNCSKIAEISMQINGKEKFFCGDCAKKYYPNEYRIYRKSLHGGEISLRNQGLFKSKSLVEAEQKKSFSDFGKKTRDFDIKSGEIQFAVSTLLHKFPDFLDNAILEVTENGDKIRSVEFFHWKLQEIPVKYVFSVLGNILWIELNGRKFYA